MLAGPTRAGKPRSTASTSARIAVAGSPAPPRQSAKRSCSILQRQVEASAWRARLAAERDPGNRIGPQTLWAKFDEALDQLGIALEGDGFAELAALFGSPSGLMR